MAFDVDGARKAGYSDSEIADHLAGDASFDISGARKAGYTDAEILDHLRPAQAAFDKPEPRPLYSAASGFNRGLAGIAGLPVDSVLNVADLLKAGYGSAAAAMGRPDLAPDLQDRSKVVGSSEYLADKLGKVASVNPASNLAADRYAFAAGSGAAGAAVSPSNAITLGARGALAGVASQAAIDNGLGPAGAAVAGFAGGATPITTRTIPELLAPKAAPADITHHIQITLQNQGIDFAGLSAETKAYLNDQVRSALSAGGYLNPQQLANAAVLKEAGIRPTSAQVTQNPTQYGTELFLRHQTAGAPLAAQYQDALDALNRKLLDLRNGIAPPVDTPTAGSRVMQPLQQADARGQSLVTRGYDQFKAVAPENVSIDGAKFANDFFALSQKEPGLRNLPRSLVGALNDLATGKTPSMSLVDAEALNQEVSRQLNNATSAEGFALNKFKSFLDDQISQSVQGDKNAADRLFAARGLASDRFTLHDQIPALKAVSLGKVSPDDFIRKFVTSPTAHVEDVGNMLSFLEKTDPGAVNQIRGQVLSQIYDNATKNTSGKFLQSSFNTDLRSLDQAGKLDLLFTPEQVATLRNIGKAGQLLEGPQGVSRNGLLGGAKAAEALSKMVDTLGSMVPKVGKFVAAPIAQAVRNVPVTMAANEALNNVPLSNLPPYAPPDRAQLLARVLGSIEPQSLSGPAR